MALQQHLDLIPRQAAGAVIHQRPTDGYINATAMCQAAGKRWFDYSRLETTGAFISTLSSEAGIPASVIVQSVRGGDPRLQGTWVHPQIAIHLAQWLSPHFAVQVSQWVLDWMSGRAKPVQPVVPYHLRRYIANQHNLPVGHFSILAEMITSLIGPMEMMGYTLPEHLLPDISEGRIFCRWLRESHGVDTDALPTYIHEYEDGRRVRAKAYPEHLLPAFRRHFREEWLPKHAEQYFRSRDSEALAYLPKLLGPIRSAQLKKVG